MSINCKRNVIIDKINATIFKASAPLRANESIETPIVQVVNESKIGNKNVDMP